MKTSVKSVRINDATARDIEQLRRGRRATFSSLASELIAEAAKMRRCPGVVFADGPSGRRARIEGTGIEVWEVIASYLALGKDEKRLKKAYAWLSDRQLLAALGYYRAYPKEMEDLVDANRDMDENIVRERLPFVRRSPR
ncbi:MAG: hypothetical protein A2Z13_03795 [Deltaproteobacteria bacterium RBG_16_64_85]|nr:MAG: hypothetical protein A2Z13_03795 [Deltaproteobacteria bacterium RBG_16_64_85]